MVHISESEGVEGRIFVVTGGSGFVGLALCLELVRRGAAEVRSLDRSVSSDHLSRLREHGVVCITGDIRQKDIVEKAFRRANCVFHLASFGMSGKEMLQARQIDEINLDGTLNVINSCMKCGVERLVYTSTYNVVFGGKEIRNGHEAMDYFPLDEHIDPYGRSKALAEQLVLKSNNKLLKESDGRRLYTCSLRPAAIYGPGESRHLPRILNYAKQGLLMFRIGGLSEKQDWVYVDNLVQAEILASMALLDDIPDKGSKARAAGKAYFISDGSPVNSFKFLTPLVEELGYKFPERELSLQTALAIAWGLWGLYGLLYPWLNKWWIPQPFILPAEVYKVGVTHYFSILRARQDLGYVPMVDPKEGMRRTTSHFKTKQDQELCGPPLWIWFSLCSAMILLSLCAWIPPHLLGPFGWAYRLGIMLFQSVLGIRVVFVVAWLLHLVEALYALQLARKVDPVNTKGWFWQTFALGYLSLGLLIERGKSRMSCKS